MALKITHFDNTDILGILDGGIDFSLHRSKGVATARIGSWTGRSTLASPSVRDMRAAAYEMLARYREHSRKVSEKSLAAA